jgi:hypothetical protein
MQDGIDLVMYDAEMDFDKHTTQFVGIILWVDEFVGDVNSRNWIHCASAQYFN